MDCILDGARGIYIGQALAQLLEGAGNYAEMADDLAILSKGPNGQSEGEGDFYFEALESVLDAWRGDQGEFLYNGENGDIFLVEGENDADWIALTEGC